MSDAKLEIRDKMPRATNCRRWRSVLYAGFFRPWNQTRPESKLGELVTNDQTRRVGAHGLLLMFVAFFGIFIYGLLAALPGAVLRPLERNLYLPNDSAVGTFLLINAIGAVLAYLISGPIIDRTGKKFALTIGA